VLAAAGNWINLDRIWAYALVAAGMVTVAVAM
jgi:hypothetical protein